MTNEIPSGRIELTMLLYIYISSSRIKCLVPNSVPTISDCQFRGASMLLVINISAGRKKFVVPNTAIPDSQSRGASLPLFHVSIGRKKSDSKKIAEVQIVNIALTMPTLRTDEDQIRRIITLYRIAFLVVPNIRFHKNAAFAVPSRRFVYRRTLREDVQCMFHFCPELSGIYKNHKNAVKEVKIVRLISRFLHSETTTCLTNYYVNTSTSSIYLTVSLLPALTSITRDNDLEEYIRAAPPMCGGIYSHPNPQYNIMGDNLINLRPGAKNIFACICSYYDSRNLTCKCEGNLCYVIAVHTEAKNGKLSSMENVRGAPPSLFIFAATTLKSLHSETTTLTSRVTKPEFALLFSYDLALRSSDFCSV